MLSGHVEIDGAYFGGHVKPKNHKAASTVGCLSTEAASAVA